MNISEELIEELKNEVKKQGNRNNHEILTELKEI